MKFVIGMIVGVLLGMATQWYFTQPKQRVTLADARENMRETAHNVGDSLKNTFDADRIKDELAKSGRVIREKSGEAGQVIADATANARITAEIKAKLIKDSSLSALKINVDTTDGVVTLSGTVASYDAISKAMTLAWETDGVRKVISTLQIKAE